jgi:hypothetical protein
MNASRKDPSLGCLASHFSLCNFRRKLNSILFDTFWVRLLGCVKEKNDDVLQLRVKVCV